MDEVIIILICLAINALLAAYEMAFVSIPRAELRALSRSGNKHAKILINLRESPERTLSIIQIGITMVGAIAAAVAGAGSGETIEPYLIQTFLLSERSAEALSLFLVVLPITYLSVVIGELVPKTLALRNPARIVLSGAPALLIADQVFSPVITALEWSTQRILKVFFPRSKSTQSTHHTTIEIDSFSPVHQRIMLNMADIERKQIKDIMLPWAQVVAIKLSATLDEVFQFVIHSGHTRLPVKDNGKIVGVLHTKEFIALRELGDANWQFIVRPVVKVQTTDSALGAMRLLQEKKNHMAIVLNAQGERLGIVTLEDILEEVVGDIFDEDDDGRIRKVYAAKIKSRVVPVEK
ncbi:MAG: HlyC/CorC family transporter [Bdellovibrionales bacterium]|nr:HlyC/CorC family transporter [Bdellovibrionales bacterium]